MVDILSEIAMVFERHAKDVFLIEHSSGRKFTYASFYEEACRSAGLLQSRDISRGDRVAIILPNSVEFVSYYFACLFLGATVIPINLTLHPREIKRLLKKSQAKLTICSAAVKQTLEEKNGEFFTEWLPPSVPEGAAIDKPSKFVAPDDLLTITFTSGTTEQPKGVAHSIASLFGNALALVRATGWQSEKRLLHILPMSYIAGFLNCILCPFMAGASVVIADEFLAARALDFWTPIIRNRVDTLWLTPTILAALLRVDRSAAGLRYCMEQVNAVYVATAPLPLQVKLDFESKYHVELMEGYGLSELLIVASNSETPVSPRGSVGRILPGIEVRIQNESRSDVEVGCDGEILVRTPYTMTGYLDDQTSGPVATDSSHWFETGDMGHLDEQGNLFITGRKKDLIIRGGLNISPRAIEEILLQHAAISQAAVVGMPHDLYGEQVVAALVLENGKSFSSELDSIKRWCESNLSAASVPAQFVEVDELPVNSNGKVRKNILREKLSTYQVQAPAEVV